MADDEQAVKRCHRQILGLEKTVDGLVAAMAKTVEFRDPFTAGHQRRVARLAEAIAQRIGFDPHRLRGMRIAGMLHDIGKICVPAEILSKPGRLSNMEFGLIQDHCRLGYEILKDIGFPWPVADIILQHHEKMDGSGYPRGIGGDRILPEARILTVADVVEAMVSHRSHRSGLGLDTALAEITMHRGRLYDPQAVDACLKVFGDDPEILG
jgi:putative nucleotidyltransferase with HDIG domain